MEQSIQQDVESFNWEDRCPRCGMSWWLFPPRRCDEAKPGGKFGPGPYVRCVDCKDVFLRPIEIAV